MDDLARDLAILGVDATATPAQVRERYRELVRRWHPDRFAGDPQGQAEAAIQMRRINDAFGRVKARHGRARESAGGPVAAPSRLSRETIERMVASLGTESVVDELLRGFGVFDGQRGSSDSPSEAHPPPWIRDFNRRSARLGMAATLATGVALAVAAFLTKVPYFVRDARGHPLDPLVDPLFLGVTGAAGLAAFLGFVWLLPRE